VNLEIFHAYDIRGIYPDDLDEESFYAIAGSYAELFKPAGKIAVGMDARQSSPALKENLIKGLIDWGVDVVDIGEITTDMLYFAVGRYGYAGGFVVSASHNPGEYNGLKLVKEGAAAISSDTGLFDIRDDLKRSPVKNPPKGAMGGYEKKEVIDDYLDHVFGFIDPSSIMPLKTVADGNFGYVGRNVLKVAERLSLDLVPVHFDPDGSFPMGPPNPMLDENRAEVESIIRNSTVDLGVTWDADADRVMFMDEKGEFIPGIYITALLSEIMLRKHPGAKIIFDPRVVWPAYDTVNRMGGVPIMAKAGHAFMKDRMRSEGAVFAGELSAHYYFCDNFFADNGIIPFLLVLEHISRQGKPFSEIMKPFLKNHFITGELNYRVEGVENVLKRVKDRFCNRGQEDFTDGYSVEGKDWRFNLRPSNTEPLLRFNVEARNTDALARIKEEVLEIIR